MYLCGMPSFSGLGSFVVVKFILSEKDLSKSYISEGK